MASSQPEPNYTVFVRLPFPRGDFVDPPPANWDSGKDEALWSIVSRLSKTEIDWNDIAFKFEVTVDFLLQQVAWLTERHASQVRAQMRKAAAAAKGSSAPSPQPGPDGPFSAEPIQRTGSSDRHQQQAPRAPSGLSIRKDSPLPRNDGSVPGTPMRSTPRPTATRTSSSNTAVYTTRNLGTSSGKAPMKPVAATPAEMQRRRLSSLPITTSVDDQEDPNPPSPGPAESSSEAASSSSSSSSSPAQSRIIRRPPRFQGNNDTTSFADDNDGDDDTDAEPAFLPYKPQPDSSAGSSGSPHDMSATLRGQPRESYASRRQPFKGPSHQIHRSQTSDSSASSATTPLKSISSDQSRSTPGGPLSPRRVMSGGKNKAAYAHDSDKDSSLHSSFSDLDVDSVTQSAIEDALASQMQRGTLDSLRGTLGAFSTAFGSSSRYLPGKSNR